MGKYISEEQVDKDVEAYHQAKADGILDEKYPVIGNVTKEEKFSPVKLAQPVFRATMWEFIKDVFKDELEEEIRKHKSDNYE